MQNINNVGKICCSFCGKKQSEVNKIIAGDNVFICDECVILCYDIIKNEKGVEERNTKISELDPEKIYNYLDQYVVGQILAKEILSVSVVNHYLRINNENLNDEIKKSNILMVGPTGTGKTLLVETLAKYLDVPFAIANATSLTEAGYVGDDVETILSRLIISAGNDIKKAEKGIIFIDEIDKKAKKENHTTRDVSGEGVQQGLLKIVEGDIVRVPLNSKRKNSSESLVEINTRNILFIVGGAFVGIKDIIKRRMNINKNFMGFGSELLSQSGDENDFNDLIKNIEPEDLIHYGMIPEFVGRFPVIVPLMELSRDELKKILKDTKNSLLNHYKNIFKLKNVDIDFTEDLIDEVVELSIKKGTGARGLHGILEPKLLKIQFDLKKYVNNDKIVVDKKIFDLINI